MTAVLLVVAVAAGACVYSSGNRADELANATATPVRNPTPPPADEGGDDAAPAEDADADADDPGDDDATEPSGDPGWVVVENVDARLNIRSGPGTENPVIDQADLGATLATTGRQELVGDTPWVEVVLEDGTGWVFGAFVAPTAQPTPTPLATPTPLPTPTPALTGDELVVDAPDGLNMRTEPRSDADRIKTLDDGTLVLPTGRTATEDSGTEWTEVTEGGDTGWVASTFLRSP